MMAGLVRTEMLTAARCCCFKPAVTRTGCHNTTTLALTSTVHDRLGFNQLFSNCLALTAWGRRGHRKVADGSYN